MKYVAWDLEKNEILKQERRVGFEDILDAMFSGGFLTILEHQNKQKYPNQRMIIVELHGYAYGVPCVEDSEKVFLKTLFPSRKYTKQYIEKGDI